ncbi:putative metal-binding motif-containing protein [Myxococcus stipitatus]|uniref:putative metal-binding motif-containing protein n=1 Tax=Myxococcus stipitatus TaxID=83455 RepID=UPI003144E671
MNRWGPWGIAGVLVLGGCSVPSLDELRAEGPGLAVEVNYTRSFKTGCIVMRVSDEANAANTSSPVMIDGSRLGAMSPPIRLGLLRAPGEKPFDVVLASEEMRNWGPTFHLTVSAYERDCGGKEVDRAELVVDMSGKGRKPSQSMSLITPDEDGDGYVATLADGRGGTDCNDKVDDPSAVKMFPGNPEVCDDVDNNCDSVVDEPFAQKGAACSADVCGGTFVCSPETKGVVCSALSPKLFYRDVDADGEGGIHEVALKVCQGETVPPGYVESAATDCDDADPSTNRRATESCDAIDNNCNGGVDEGLSACGGTLKQVTDYHLSSANQGWMTVSMGLSGYPVWIAGTGGKLAVRMAPSEKFRSFSFNDPTTTPPDGSPPVSAKNCGDHDWTVSWVDSEGRVFLGAKGGWFALHNGVPNLDCLPGITPPRSGSGSPFDITGIVGFEAESERFIYFTDAGGRLIRWKVGTAPVVLDDLGATEGLSFHGLHGLSEDFLLAGGGSSPVGPEIVRFEASPGATPPSHDHFSLLSNPGTGSIRAVWMGKERLGCVVGDGGGAWRQDKAAVLVWSRAPAVPGGPVNFTSVVMRYDQSNPQSLANEQCYMVDSSSSGRLRRWTPHGWAKEVPLPSAANVPLRDLAMNPTGSEFWIVGDQGRVFHYPEP